MLTNADKLKAEITAQKALIAENDKQIEEAERRQALRRRHGDSLFRALLRLEGELAREEAPLQIEQRVPTGHCVKITAPDGVEWSL